MNSYPRGWLSGRPFLMATLALVLLWPAAAQNENTLDQYVHTGDPAFTWELVKSYNSFGYGTYIVRVTSQKWRDFQEVDPVFWQHWLRVVVPTGFVRGPAVLLINGGSWNSEQPGPADPTVGLASAVTGLVIAELTAVPAQPLQFTDESHTRSEDAIIAYSWDKFLRTGDETWPVQLPMTKAAVAAMDVVEELIADDRVVGREIEGFIVAGGSKRGWTSWLATAVDSRVLAVTPIVFDALNLEPSLAHHWQAYGFMSPAVQDYVDMGIFAWRGSPEMRSLIRLVDPYSYLERLDLPKLIVNASGDQFFLPDSSQFYFDDLPGTNFLRYIPNASHSLAGHETDVLLSSLAWIQAVISGSPLPHYVWEYPDPATIRVRTDLEPTVVKLWQAANPTARDFRVDTIGEAWESVEVPASGDGSYEATVAQPAQGWRAFFLELTYPSQGIADHVFTTPVRVIPDTLPFGPPVASVLAASFHPLTAADAIVSGFGSGLAGQSEAAASRPLPTELAGIQVRIIDANGVSRLAPLFFVSPEQINYLVPAGTAAGVAELDVLENGQRIEGGQLLIEPIAPGLFSANDDGQAVAAAVALTVKPNGAQESMVIFEQNQPVGSREPVGVALRSGEQVYLLLFGTGMRNATEVTATVGGEPVDVLGPAPSQEYAGLDQVNIGPLPLSLSRAGEVDIVLVVNGIRANVVTVTIL